MQIKSYVDYTNPYVIIVGLLSGALVFYIIRYHVSDRDKELRKDYLAISIPLVVLFVVMLGMTQYQNIRRRPTVPSSNFYS